MAQDGDGMIFLKRETCNTWSHKNVPCLVPTDEESQDALRKMHEGQIVAVEAKRARNHLQHKKFFALLKIAFDNQQTDFGSVEELRKALLIGAGYTEPQRRLNGEIVLVAKSMSYHNMPKAEFEEMYDKVMDLICVHVMPGMDREALEDERRNAA